VNEFERYPAMRPSGLNWIDELPSHWAERRGKFLFSLKQRPVRPVDGVVTAFRDGQVTLRTNRRTDGFTNSLKEIGYQGVREGDLVIHAMDGFAGAIGVSDSDGKCSPVYSCCTQRKNSDAYFYAYLLRNMAATGFIESLAKGIRERSTDFRWKDFSELSLPLPPVEEQRTIAKKLDRETARIDALIEKKTRFIELLKEKRQALITQAVTKGLDPTVPMKDSGVAWIGEVPAHWEVVRVKHVTLRIEQGWSPQCENQPADDDEWAVLKVGCVNGGVFNKRENKALPAELKPVPALSLKANDLLVSRANTRELVGSAAVVQADQPKIMLCDKLYRLKIDESSAAPEFIAHMLATGRARGQIELDANGASSSMLITPAIKTTKPSHSELWGG
jgi:type I restriction enzyme S subunit